MKNQEYESMGLKVNIPVPETVAEFDANAKKDGACLAEAINNIVYRSFLADSRDIFLHGDTDDKNNVTFEGLEQILAKTHPKIDKRKTKVLRKAKDGSDIVGYDETEKEYFDRVLAETKQERTAYQPLMDAVAKHVKFDASATERKARGPVKIGQNWLDAAKSMIESNDFTNLEKGHKKFFNEPFVHPTVETPTKQAGQSKEDYETELKKSSELRINLYARAIKKVVDAKVEADLKMGKF